jgi:hypothetical protein
VEGNAVPYATNPLDRVRTYFEDSEGADAPILFFTGFADPLEVAKRSRLARELKRRVPPDLDRHGQRGSDKLREVTP